MLAEYSVAEHTTTSSSPTIQVGMPFGGQIVPAVLESSISPDATCDSCPVRSARSSPLKTKPSVEDPCREAFIVMQRILRSAAILAFVSIWRCEFVKVGRKVRIVLEPFPGGYYEPIWTYRRQFEDNTYWTNSAYSSGAYGRYAPKSLPFRKEYLPTHVVASGNKGLEISHKSPNRVPATRV